MAAGTETIIPLDEVARRTGVSLRTLTDRAWRARVGLPAIKLGGRILGVRERDLARALRRERLGRGRVNGDSAA